MPSKRNKKPPAKFVPAPEDKPKQQKAQRTAVANGPEKKRKYKECGESEPMYQPGEQPWHPGLLLVNLAAAVSAGAKADPALEQPPSFDDPVVRAAKASEPEDAADFGTFMWKLLPIDDRYFFLALRNQEQTPAVTTERQLTRYLHGERLSPSTVAKLDAIGMQWRTLLILRDQEVLGDCFRQLAESGAYGDLGRVREMCVASVRGAGEKNKKLYMWACGLTPGSKITAVALGRHGQGLAILPNSGFGEDIPLAEMIERAAASPPVIHSIA